VNDTAYADNIDHTLQRVETAASSQLYTQDKDFLSEV